MADDRHTSLGLDSGGGGEGGGSGGAGGGTWSVVGLGGGTPEEPDEDAPVSDSGPYVIDRFNDRTVTPPSLTDGDSVGSWSIGGGASQGRRFEIGPWALFPVQDESPIEVPFTFTVGQSGATISDYYQSQPWTARPSWSACGGLDYCFIGYSEREQWYKLTIGAHPANAAGIAVDVQVSAADQCKGYGKVGPVDIVVGSAQPVQMRSGTVISTLIAGQSATVIVPIADVPAEGGVLWLGYRTGWSVTSKTSTQGYTCGWPSLSGFQAYDFDSGGVAYGGYAGRVAIIAPTSPTWQVLSTGSTDFGSTTIPDDAPFGGPHDWQAVVESGAPTAGIDADGLYATSTAPSAMSFTLTGPGEDDDEDDGPWSIYEGWRVDVEFDTDALGLTDQAGTRVIELVSAAEGQTATARVHLGDTGRAMGISVDGGLGEQYKAKTFVADTHYILAMDLRSTYLRAKVWEASSRLTEPALWDVQVPIAGSDAENDHFTLRLKVGNVVSAQRVTVHKVTAAASGQLGDTVVGELVGIADGAAQTFPSAHQFEPRSLTATINGALERPTLESPQDAEYSLDFPPTAGSILRCRYVVAGADSEP